MTTPNNHPTAGVVLTFSTFPMQRRDTLILMMLTIEAMQMPLDEWNRCVPLIRATGWAANEALLLVSVSVRYHPNGYGETRGRSFCRPTYRNRAHRNGAWWRPYRLDLYYERSVFRTGIIQ